MEKLTTSQAAKCLQNGKLVAIPTETVYGLAGNALRSDVVSNIFSTKKRPSNNPLIVHLPDPERVFKYATRCAIAKKLSTLWPGPLTIVTRHNQKIPKIVTAGSELCAFRVPDHPTALEILKKSNIPLAAPSANTANKRSPTSIAMIEASLVNQICGVVDGGPCRIGIESTVVEIIPDRGVVIHRPGSISKNQIEALAIAVLKPQQNLSPPDNDSPGNLSPGLQESHYAPDKPLILLPDLWGKQCRSEEERKINADITLSSFFRNKNFSNISILKFGESGPTLPDGVDLVGEYQLSKSNNLQEAAKNLFDSFDKLSKTKCDAIVCYLFGDDGIGHALNDRLIRAATYNLTLL